MHISFFRVLRRSRIPLASTKLTVLSRVALFHTSASSRKGHMSRTIGSRTRILPSCVVRSSNPSLTLIADESRQRPQPQMCNDCRLVNGVTGSNPPPDTSFPNKILAQYTCAAVSLTVVVTAAGPPC